jgi:hypothetical protein
MSEFYPDSHSDTEEDVKLVKHKCECKKMSCKVCFPQEYKSVPDSE